MIDAPLKVGISTCPNDTYSFGGLLDGEIADVPAMDFVLEDIQALNDHALAGEYDVAKVSFYAALKLAKDYRVLPVGAALGYGVGPLLLAANDELASRLPQAGDRVLCPGQWTTATLLYKLFCPPPGTPGTPEKPVTLESGLPELPGVPGGALSHVVFSEIMPMLARGDAAYGVVIHEGRFTYAQQGLSVAMDIGKLWETQMNQPLPLGGLVIRRSLSDEVAQQVVIAVRKSIEHAVAHPQKALAVMSRYAQELSDQVLWEHVKLYVNETTVDLGSVGRSSLESLCQCAREVGLIGQDVDLF